MSAVDKPERFHNPAASAPYPFNPQCQLGYDDKKKYLQAF
jgi:hypothetical protein